MKTTEETPLIKNPNVIETPLSKKRWLDPKELYLEYGFTESNQGKLRMRRAIPFSKIGNYIRYDRIEIDKWIESNKVEVVA